MKLFTDRNTKINKSNKSGMGYFSKILHLAPYTLSGQNVCPQASAGCAAACLNTAGYGAYKMVQDARIKRTKWFFDDRPSFISQLRREIENFVKLCKRKGLKPAIRLNGTSDLQWEKLEPSLFTDFSMVQFYDYTKITNRMLGFCLGRFPSNYHLTFSRSESNQNHVDMIMQAGGNVAVVFFKELPNEWKGRKVIDADKDDQRFLDPPNVVCGLSAKGRGKHDGTGFVIL